MAEKGSMFSLPVMKHIKGNYSLIPLFGVLGLGVAFAAFHSIRQMSKNPDVVINRKGNPKPYEKLINADGTSVQYKYYSTKDYSKIKVDAERPNL